MEDYSEIKSDGEYIIIPNPIYDERDEYLKILINRDNTISALEMKLEERQQVIKEKEKVIENNKKIILELARTLKENNVPANIIQKKTNLSIEEIRGL